MPRPRLLSAPPFVTLAIVLAAVAAPALVRAQQVDDEVVIHPTEPDLVIVNLPTNMGLPSGAGNFRMTHRFAGNLRNGSFAENASNLFGLDQGAIIGFEYRRGLMRDLQVAIFRTNFDKTIQLYGKYDALREGRLPVSVSVLASIEGADNFQERYAPAVGLVVSRRFGTRLALYAVPMAVGNTNASVAPIEHDHGGDGAQHEDDITPPANRLGTVMVGVGGRARLTSSVYVVAEVTPRLDGYRPNEAEYGFGFEKRLGGHVFALTFTNTFGTTYAQLARGGTARSLYLGFNLGRKFF